jgi:hypothetical protein
MKKLIAGAIGIVFLMPTAAHATNLWEVLNGFGQPVNYGTVQPSQSVYNYRPQQSAPTYTERYYRPQTYASNYVDCNSMDQLGRWERRRSCPQNYPLSPRLRRLSYPDNGSTFNFDRFQPGDSLGNTLLTGLFLARWGRPW